jgi:hypothetical protein
MDLCSILGSLEGFWTTDETIDGLMLNKCLGSVSVCFPFCTELVGYLVPTHATMKMHVLSCKDILHAARKLRGEQFTSTDSLCFTEKKKEEDSYSTKSTRIVCMGREHDGKLDQR